MSERFATWIQIGGKLPRSKVKPLLKAISQVGVSLEWGDALFTPNTADDLLASRKEGYLWLCDDEASWGQFPELEQACRRLRLPYIRCCDGNCAYDAERVDWRPGMKEPLSRRSSVEHSGETLVQASRVREALSVLEAGNTRKAIAKLRSLCPVIPAIPPFEVV
jgi:hypothetical protein